MANGPSKQHAKVGNFTLGEDRTEIVRVVLLADMGAYHRIDLADPNAATPEQRKAFPKVVFAGTVKWS